MPTRVFTNYAGPECIGFYKQSAHPFPALKIKIHEVRKSLLEKTEMSEMVVNGIEYKILGKLRGDRYRVQVYLCEAPNGKLVQIKKTFDNTTWPNSIYYEMAVTRYYQEQGLIVPSVKDHKVEYSNVNGSKYMTAIIVKEYFEGLTGTDLFFGHDSFSAAEVDHMNQRVEAHRSRVAQIHKGFSHWLEKNKIDLFKTEFTRMKLLIDFGDLDGRNILYNAGVDDGVIFDP